ncbi:E3 ubiquitin-protein ligase IAP-3-like [Tropilaelaps mercedesae]|uniref:E3 ubiquitin-protein ligase IAP-3-like n=1 Tax=Tropilaelaps mercedesae TaxID=418985 RepID=A0A1V9Y1Z1_9ACAR|nr:E3 ubiquitin-protein ligase IAP-3-like [Tropilaelaps mercedesae]
MLDIATGLLNAFVRGIDGYLSRSHGVKGKLASPSQTKAKLAYPEYQNFNERLSTFEAKAQDHEDVRAVALAGFFLIERTLKCYACGWSTPSEPHPTDIIAEHLQERPRCAKAQSEHLRKKMKKLLSERRKTFTGRWTQSIPSGDQLAKSGFYLNQQEVAVPECAFCRVQISSWPPDEHPFDTHGRLSPYCAFVLNPPSYAGYDVCGPGRYGQAVPTAESRSSPKYPNMVSPDVRLKTFDSWKGPVSEEVLVAAGLFSLGHHGYTMCYHCGIGIENWEKEDDPWEVHARISPNCELVRLRRGRRSNAMEKVPSEGGTQANVSAVEQMPPGQPPAAFSISSLVDPVSSRSTPPSEAGVGPGSQAASLPHVSASGLPACTTTVPLLVLGTEWRSLTTVKSAEFACECDGSVRQRHLGLVGDSSLLPDSAVGSPLMKQTGRPHAPSDDNGADVNDNTTTQRGCYSC